MDHLVTCCKLVYNYRIYCLKFANIVCRESWSCFLSVILKLQRSLNFFRILYSTLCSQNGYHVMFLLYQGNSRHCHLQIDLFLVNAYVVLFSVYHRIKNNAKF